MMDSTKQNQELQKIQDQVKSMVGLQPGAVVIINTLIEMIKKMSSEMTINKSIDKMMTVYNGNINEMMMRESIEYSMWRSELTMSVFNGPYVRKCYYGILSWGAWAAAVEDDGEGTYVILPFNYRGTTVKYDLNCETGAYQKVESEGDAMSTDPIIVRVSVSADGCVGTRIDR
jgi:hypothetical protein